MIALGARSPLVYTRDSHDLRYDAYALASGNPMELRIMSAAEHALLEKLRTLPPRRLAEVEDFVDFLRAREAQASLVQTAAYASEPSFAAVWSNDADSAYDGI